LLRNCQHVTEPCAFQTGPPSSKKTKSARGGSRPGPGKDDLEKFGMMLEENAQDKYVVAYFAVRCFPRNECVLQKVTWLSQTNFSSSHLAKGWLLLSVNCLFPFNLHICRNPDVLECQGLSVNFLSQLVMPLILEHLVVLENS